MILAEITQLPSPDSPQAIGWLFIAVAGAFAAINQILRLTDRLKEKPTPAETYALKVEQHELKTRVDKIAEDIARGFERLDQKRSVSIAGVHDDLERTITELRKEMKSDNEGLNTRITEVLSAVSEIKGRIAKL